MSRFKLVHIHDTTGIYAIFDSWTFKCSLLELDDFLRFKESHDIDYKDGFNNGSNALSAKFSLLYPNSFIYINEIGAFVDIKADSEERVNLSGVRGIYLNFLSNIKSTLVLSDSMEFVTVNPTTPTYMYMCKFDISGVTRYDLLYQAYYLVDKYRYFTIDDNVSRQSLFEPVSFMFSSNLGLHLYTLNSKSFTADSDTLFIEHFSDYIYSRFTIEVKDLFPRFIKFSDNAEDSINFFKSLKSVLSEDDFSMVKPLLLYVLLGGKCAVIHDRVNAFLEFLGKGEVGCISV